MDPLGYLDFLALMAGARAVLTDSGGIQEETTALGVRCLTLRPNTERPVTIERGTNQLVELDAECISRAALSTNGNRRRKARPPLWDGRAGERIAHVLVNDTEPGF
jgi:UDP-N-acetylglucosamine 2-epimerase (non-hydrolysing)